MVRFRRFRYSVPEEDVAKFVRDNENAGDFLNQYEAGGVTYAEKAVGLARFFRWLKVVKELDLTPSEFLNTHLRKRAADNVEDRRWALKLALEYSRDNPDLKEKAINYKYSAFFLPVKKFCDYNEAPLTTTVGLFKKRGRRKYPEHPFTVDFVKRALAVLMQRDRAVAMVQLQAGQAIKQVLVDVNLECKRVFREIDAGRQRIRFDFAERKGNGFAYFSYISRDAIQEIQKWRPIREQILEKLGAESEYLFITESGKPLSCKQFHTYNRKVFIRNGLYKGPLSVRSHGFRKFFEQEASPPERGISKAYITFMMGHSSGKDSNNVQVTHPLDTPGGVYDNCPRVYPDVVEKEYAKLERWINIYSSPAVAPLPAMSEDQQRTWTVLNEALSRDPEKFRRFKKFIMDL